MPVWKKSQDGKLTITDENANGKLIATGGDYGAGIGGDDQGNGKTSPSPAARSQLPVAAMERASVEATMAMAMISPSPAERSQLPAAMAQRALAEATIKTAMISTSPAAKSQLPAEVMGQALAEATRAMAKTSPSPAAG